jgi:hypothetical protein
MTMEMGEQSVMMERWRLLTFVLAGLPLLYGLAYYAGFSCGNAKQPPAKTGLHTSLIGRA